MLSAKIPHTLSVTYATLNAEQLSQLVAQFARHAEYTSIHTLPVQNKEHRTVGYTCTFFISWHNYPLMRAIQIMDELIQQSEIWCAFDATGNRVEVNHEWYATLHRTPGAELDIDGLSTTEQEILSKSNRQ